MSKQRRHRTRSGARVGQRQRRPSSAGTTEASARTEPVSACKHRVRLLARQVCLLMYALVDTLNASLMKRLQRLRGFFFAHFSLAGMFSFKERAQLTMCRNVPHMTA